MAQYINGVAMPEVQPLLLKLSNDVATDVPSLEYPAAVIPGFPLCFVPPAVARLLQLRVIGTRRFHATDEVERELDYVSPVKIELLGRSCVAGAIVFGDCVQLGSIALSDLGLTVDPGLNIVKSTPAAAEIPRSIAVGVRG